MSTRCRTVDEDSAVFSRPFFTLWSSGNVPLGSELALLFDDLPVRTSTCFGLAGVFRVLLSKSCPQAHSSRGSERTRCVPARKMPHSFPVLLADLLVLEFPLCHYRQVGVSELPSAVGEKVMYKPYTFRRYNLFTRAENTCICAPILTIATFPL